MTAHSHQFQTYALSDRYSQTEGRVFLTGTQALVRIMLDQARRDRDAGLNTASSPAIAARHWALSILSFGAHARMSRKTGLPSCRR